MKGKTCLITGATAGIGKCAAVALAERGARLVIVSRDSARGEKAKEEITRLTGNSQVELIIADLSSQQSTRDLAREFGRRFDRLDVLINNAGALYPGRTLTVDGIEATFAINHLAYFLLTDLLLPILKASPPSRIVNVSSGAHKPARLDFDDLQGQKKYSGWSAYSKSKLANVLFTYELARRLEGTGVTANCLHPGAVRTELFRNFSGVMSLAVKLAGPFLRTPQKGAETTIYLTSSPEVEGVSRKYFVNCKEARSSEASYDEAAARRLWEVSEHLTRPAASAAQPA